MSHVHFLFSKSFLRAFVFISLSSIFFMCSSSKDLVEEVEKIPVSFDYSPKSSVRAGSSNLTIALVSPIFGGNYRNPIFSQFSNSMANDFEELLTSKGIKIRGPFHTRGEMVYNDKKESDLILEPEIEFNFSNISRKSNRKVKKPSFGERLTNAYATSTVFYTYTGNGSYTIDLNLVYKSTNYQEKIKIENLPVRPPQSFKYEGSAKWVDSDVSFLGEIEQDNVVYNNFAKTLMNLYQKTFELLERKIEVIQLEDYKKQAHEIDDKNEE